MRGLVNPLMAEQGISLVDFPPMKSRISYMRQKSTNVSSSDVEILSKWFFPIDVSEYKLYVKMIFIDFYSVVRRTFVHVP